jgi:hypothetical protein
MSAHSPSAPQSPNVFNHSVFQIHSIDNILNILCESIEQLCQSEVDRQTVIEAKRQSITEELANAAKYADDQNDEDASLPSPPTYSMFRRAADEARVKAEERLAAGDQVMQHLLQRIQHVWLHLIDCLSGSHNADTERDVGKIFFVHVCAPVSELSSRYFPPARHA